MESGDLDNALKYYHNGLDIKRGIFNEDHPSIGISIYNIGKCFHDLGNAEKAREYYDKAYDIFTISLGEEHPNSRRIKEKIAILNDL
jgi:tetratricopeptide (TPR) repeat protein